MRIKRKRRYQEVEPDEILIDAQNLPGFDAARLEGRIERPIERRIFRDFLLLSLLIGIIFLSQLAKLQIIDAASLKERAEANRLHQTLILAERGRIVDRNGVPLALNEPHPELGFSKRTYPLGEAAAHITGYVSYPKRDQNEYWFQETTEGLAGIEFIYDDLLRGENGLEIRETSALGETVSGSTIRAPEKGSEVALSIDAALQEKLFDMIRERALDAKFIGGSGVIVDVHSGEVLALASYPSFDPAVISSGEDTETINQYLTGAQASLLDRAVSGLYTPGSVVKPFVAVAALEEKIISPHKEILSTGSISIPNPYDPSLPSVFRDWRAHGWTDMREAIAVSSDVYFYAVGGGYEDQQGLGISAIDAYMHRFGFGEPTGIELAGEEVGVVPNPEWKASTFDGERWFLGNTYHTSIGQYGFQVSVVQLARAVAALVNGGYLVTPTLSMQQNSEKKFLNFEDENLQVAREGMHQAVETGTAQALNIHGVEVGAKTGTAEVGARKEFINSLIVGFFPYENPRYAFAVVMERAKAGTTAGAPLVMRNVLEWVVEERPGMTQ